VSAIFAAASAICVFVALEKVGSPSVLFAFAVFNALGSIRYSIKENAK
jgi:hypothetical protein